MNGNAELQLELSAAPVTSLCVVSERNKMKNVIRIFLAKA